MDDDCRLIPIRRH